jgi:hypothetical protein
MRIGNTKAEAEDFRCVQRDGRMHGEGLSDAVARR